MTEIRRAKREDVPRCAKVLNDWIDSTEWMPRLHSVDEIEAMIDGAFDKREIWVAGDPVDAYLSFDPETQKVGGLYCQRTGQGVGKALLDQVRAGRDYVWLTADEPNDQAQKFYAREGFVEVSRYMPEPPEMVRHVELEWRA